MKVDLDINKIAKEVGLAADELCRTLALETAKLARKSADFRDKTGNLRKSIKMKKSRYQGGGYIARAGAPHAHLIEYGYRTKSGGVVPPRPFMRTAKDKTASEANVRALAEKMLKKRGF
jgi:hypothetical protein